MYKDQFTLTGRLEHIMRQPFGPDSFQSQFLFCLTFQCRLHTLAQFHMSAHSCIPPAWLYIFPFRTLLQVEFPTTVKHMQMYYGMQPFATAVTLTARGGPHDISVLVNKWKHLLTVILSGCNHINLSFFKFNMPDRLQGMSNELSP